MSLTYVVLSSPSQVAPYQNAIKQHLVDLPPEDRNFRFFSVSDASIDFWLKKITTSSNSKHIVVLILNEEQVVAAGDIAYTEPTGIAELALSVSVDFRKVTVNTTAKPNELEVSNSGTKMAKWLVGALIDIAKEAGFSGVVYSTMSDNQKMLALGKAMGFSHKWVDGAVKGEIVFREVEL